MDTIRIRTPQSLLQLLPHLVGETGAPSLVALPFTDGRSGMPMVVDLPGPGDAPAVAAAIRGGLFGARAVALIACFATPLGADPLPLHDELVDIAGDLSGSGVHTLELLAMGPDAWGDYAYPEAARGPLAELDLLADPAPGVPAARSAPAVPSGHDGPEVQAVASWLEALRHADVAAARSAPIDALELAVELVPRLGAGPGALGIDPAKAVALAIVLVVSPATRDLAIELAIDGRDAAAASFAAQQDRDPALDRAAASRFIGAGPTPDAERLHDRLRRWSAITEAAPLEARAPLLVIVGFLHFFVGRGRTAARCAQLAMTIDPSLSMAPLLLTIIDARGAPDWVLQPDKNGALPPHASGADAR